MNLLSVLFEQTDRIDTAEKLQAFMKEIMERAEETLRGEITGAAFLDAVEDGFEKPLLGITIRKIVG